MPLQVLQKKHAWIHTNRICYAAVINYGLGTLQSFANLSIAILFSRRFHLIQHSYSQWNR